MLRKVQANNFYSQEKEEFLLENDFDKIKAYKLKQTGQVVFEYEIDCNLGEGNQVEITQITDVHLNYVLDEELTDEEIFETKKHRLWLANAESLPSLQGALEGAIHSDLTVITGDILDYLSKGAMKLMKENIFDKYPKVLCTAGGHELTKQMQTGKMDKLPLPDRVKILQDFWNCDFYYEKRLVGKKVLAVAINNGFGYYFDHQIKKLSADIETARKEGKIILIFQHEPLSTKKESDSLVNAFYFAYGNATQMNFYNRKNCIGYFGSDVEINNKMVDLITSNADVIKGIFVGHLHSGYYTEINTCYFSNEKKIDAKIPQIVAPGNPYFERGCFVRIKIS